MQYPCYTITTFVPGEYQHWSSYKQDGTPRENAKLVTKRFGHPLGDWRVNCDILIDAPIGILGPGAPRQFRIKYYARRPTDKWYSNVPPEHLHEHKARCTLM